MNNSTIIAIVLVISVSFMAGMWAAENTGLLSQSSYRVSVGMPKSQMNWGRGWNPVEKTSGRAITMCIPGEKKCLTEEGFATCQESGTSWSYLTPCPELFYCEKELNQCIPYDCIHGTTYCRDSVFYLKCIAGRLDIDNAYECEFGCDILNNTCRTEPLPEKIIFPSSLIDAFN